MDARRNIKHYVKGKNLKLIDFLGEAIGVNAGMSLVKLIIIFRDYRPMNLKNK